MMISERCGLCGGEISAGYPADAERAAVVHRWPSACITFLRERAGELEATLDVVFGQHPDDAPPPIDEPVQIILNAIRRPGVGGDYWLTHSSSSQPAMILDSWVVGWRPGWAGSPRGVEMREEGLRWEQAAE